MLESRPLQGRRALVTGSVGGLGKVMARQLAHAGASVMISGLEAPEEVEAARAELAHASGSTVGYAQADLTILADIEGLAKRACDELGPIDILLNSAVVRHFSPLEQFPVDRWNEALAVNLSAPFHLTRLLLPSMRANGYGRIFNFTSVYGSHGTAGRVDYVCTKSAIEGLTRATAVECADGAVSCHALCPGSMLTPSLEVRVRTLAETENLDWEQATTKFLQGKNPTGRFVEESSVSDVMLFLCGPVGRDMNGAIIPIEGGWLAKA